ncbi:hypothetical protein GQ43DRAFT_476490 [Delitschia confertaspora ATCC 74209]|uniref:Heat shock factor binding protein 1 n=1 Tax=Delitschia confertaspora ATCC 74209 TaxID=1513339 RepID=A0A9P4JEA4_9PLEO|nr:hypothetical protein GQ43DRAFT_476490 [Delitschia confertaspora ATCC 74209]
MSKRPETSDAPLATPTMNAAGDTSTSELTAVVEELLGQLSTKFSSVSSELLSKMDDMSRRLDNLEATIQANEGSKPSGSGSAK